MLHPMQTTKRLRLSFYEVVRSVSLSPFCWKASLTQNLSSFSCTKDRQGFRSELSRRYARKEGPNPLDIHAVILDPHHAIAKLLFKEYDENHLYRGPDCVFAKMRQQYLVLRGRQGRAKPVTSIMADLPPAHLRLYQPAFFFSKL